MEGHSSFLSVNKKPNYYFGGGYETGDYERELTASLFHFFAPPGGVTLILPSHNKIHDIQRARKDRQCYGVTTPIHVQDVYVSCNQSCCLSKTGQAARGPVVSPFVCFLPEWTPGTIIFLEHFEQECTSSCLQNSKLVELFQSRE